MPNPNAEDVKRKAQDLYESVKDYLSETQEQIMANLHSQVDEAANQVSAWKAHVGEATNQQSEQAKATLDQARMHYEEARVQLNLLMMDASSAWDKAKPGVNKAVEDLRRALDAAASQFK